MSQAKGRGTIDKEELFTYQPQGNTLYLNLEVRLRKREEEREREKERREGKDKDKDKDKHSCCILVRP